MNDLPVIRTRSINEALSLVQVFQFTYTFNWVNVLTCRGANEG
jgi:hypothetical protein